MLGLFGSTISRVVIFGHFWISDFGQPQNLTLDSQTYSVLSESTYRNYVVFSSFREQEKTELLHPALP